MRKSKLDSVLKGIAVAGIAVGGASIVQSGDVVFAKELEHLNEGDEEEQLLSEEFLAASTSASTSEYTSEEYTEESEDTSLAADSEAMVASVAEDQSDAQEESASVTAEVAPAQQQMPNMVMAGMQVEAGPMTVREENIDPAQQVQIAQKEETTAHTSEYTAESEASSEAVQTVTKSKETTDMAAVTDTRQSAAESAQTADVSKQMKTATEDEEKVPLAVREENIANTRYEEQRLEENQTPLAANVQSEKSHSLLALIPAVAAVIAGKTVYDRKTGKLLKRK